MLACEHGGMNESLAELYACTGNEKYLELSRALPPQGRSRPARREGGPPQRPPRQHADPEDHRRCAAVRADRRSGSRRSQRRSSGNVVVHHHTYVIGGNSDGEHFGPPGQARRPPRRQHDRDLQHLQHAQAHAAPLQLAPDGRAMPTTTSGRSTTTSSPRRTRRRDDVLLRHAQAGRSQDLLDAVRQLLVLRRHRHGEPRQVRRRASTFTTTTRVWVNLFIASELRWKEKGLDDSAGDPLPGADTTTPDLYVRQAGRRLASRPLPSWTAGALAGKGERQGADAAPKSPAATSRSTEVEDRRPRRDEPADAAAARGDAGQPEPRRDALRPDRAGGRSRARGDRGCEAPPCRCSSPEVSAWSNGRSPCRRDEAHSIRTNVGRPGDVTLLAVLRDARTGATRSTGTCSRRAAVGASARPSTGRRRRGSGSWRPHGRSPGSARCSPSATTTCRGRRPRAGDVRRPKWRHAIDGGWFSFDMRVCRMARPSGPHLLGQRQRRARVRHPGGRDEDRHADAPEQQAQRSSSTSHTRSPRISRAASRRCAVRLQAHPGRITGGVFGLRMICGTAE